MKKRNHEIFGGFQNLETRFKNISLPKKKNFFGNIFERDFFPDFGENFMISFFHPLCFNRNLFPEEKISFISKV